jgi:hypothetical protein
MRRRQFLHAATVSTAVAIAGCADRTGNAEEKTVTDRTTAADRADTTDTAEPRAERGLNDRQTDFVWAERPLWTDEAVRRNLLAFARRHDLAVLLAKPGPTDASLATLEAALAAAAEAGVEAWLNVGVLSEVSAPALVADRSQREAHLRRLRTILTRYRDRFPAGRVVLWQEAPVGGAWVENGYWNDDAVRNLESLGPEVFAAQQRTIRAVAPEVEVGVFAHFPYIIPSRQPETFATLTEGLARIGAHPDFAFVDFYRGWYEKDVGPEPANEAIRSLIANASEHLGGREVLYLGESHTINPQYTPSRQAIQMDLRASRAADGRGWYARTRYVGTERGFDPFVPNVGSATGLRKESRASTLTFARDRYCYAYASLLARRAEYGPRERFDLWVHGVDLDFYDHELSVRTSAGDWEFLADINGYLDGAYPYSGGTGEHVAIVHALDRDRLVGEGGVLDVQIDTSPASDSAELLSVAAVPFDVGTYRSEKDALALTGDPQFPSTCLGHVAPDVPLEPGDSRRVRLPIADPDGPDEPGGAITSGEPNEPGGLGALLFPEHRSQRRRVQAFEADEGFYPGDVFDLWIDTSGADGTNLVDSLYAPDQGGTDRRFLAEASVAASATRNGIVFYGLDRAQFLPRTGEELALDIEGTNSGRGAIGAVYAMPYFGNDTFVTAARAAALMAEPSEGVRTFSLAYSQE